MKESNAAPAPLQAVPEVLRRLDRWIGWRLVKNPAGKLTKRPDCSTRDASRWRRFDAFDPLQVTNESGVGFVLTGGTDVDGGRLFALDLDACRDPQTGELTDWALQIVQQFERTYTEVTPSGAGLRVWLIAARYPETLLRAKVLVSAAAPPGVDKKPELQVFGYGVPQFVTVTGQPLPGTSAEILVVDSLDWLLEEYELQAGDARGDAPGSLPRGVGDIPTTDAVEAVLRADPRARSIFDAEWRDAATGEDKSASGAFFHVAQAALRAANGHGKPALDFLLHRTAWGRADVEESADPARYGRASWVAAELRRIGEKTDANAGAAFDDDFDPSAWTPPPDAPDHPEENPTPARSPILTVESPRPLYEAAPPARDYLLHHPDGEGFVPRGKPGLLNAAGGTGKTTALVQLAVCLATGRPWLGHYETPAEPQRVLMLLGEEDEEEVRRKLYWTSEAMGLEAAEHRAVEEFVVALPLAGHALPLLRAGEHGNLEGTEHSDAVLELLHTRDDWGFVVVDPVSRFTGVNTEGDNIVATRYAQELERFCKAPGKPTVCAVGHTSKQARKDGEADFRGVTGLFDAVRWALTLNVPSKEQPRRLKLDVAKNNLAPPSEGIALVRGERGLLYGETPEEARERENEEAEAEAARERTKDELAVQRREFALSAALDKIVAFVQRTPGASANEIASAVTGKRSHVLDAVRRAVATGLVRVEPMARNKVGHFISGLLK